MWSPRRASTCFALLFASTATFAQNPSAPSPPSADCAAASVPNQQKDEDTLRRIEQGWLTAEYRGDVRYLDCLLEPDYRTSGRDGKIRTRAELLERVQHVTDTSRDVPTLDVIVVIHGDAASAHSIMHTTDKSGNPKDVHFVDTYTFHDGRWHAFSGADL